MCGPGSAYPGAIVCGQVQMRSGPFARVPEYGDWRMQAWLTGPERHLFGNTLARAGEAAIP